MTSNIRYVLLGSVEENPAKLNLLYLRLKAFLASNYLKLISVFAIAIAIPLTMFLAQNQQTIVQKASPSTEKARILGYIVEFKKTPVYRSLGRTNIKSLTTADKSQIESSKKDLQIEHLEAKTEILKVLNKKTFSFDKTDKFNVKINGEYSGVFNGVALDITREDADKLKASSRYIKNVYEDLEVKTNLRQSVPLIGANSIWSKVKDNSGNAVDGRGIKIAVLDTGVDFTHEDLGATKVEERPFTKISDIPSRTNFGDMALAYNNNRVAYPAGYGSIYVYDFATKTNTKYSADTGLANPLIQSVYLYNNYLFYLVQSYEAINLYVQDLTTKQVRMISDMGIVDGTYASVFSKFSIWNNKLVFERISSSTLVGDTNHSKYNVFTYDLTTGEEKPFLEEAPFARMPRVYGNKMIYRTATQWSGSSALGCTQSLYLRDLTTGTEEKLDLPETADSVIDFKGDNIIFANCGRFGEYTLYNLQTKTSKILNYYAALKETNFSAQSSVTALGITSLKNAQIGENIVYFQKDGGSTQMIGYDLAKNKYIKINLINPISEIAGEGDRMCFVNKINNYIYCFDYDKNITYPDLNSLTNSKIIGGYNFINDTDDFTDDYGHGTHVAGIIAGNGSLKGVAPNSQLVIYKVLKSNGTGAFSYILKALDAIAATRTDSDLTNDISILNMSLGGNCGASYSVNCGPDDVVSKALDNLSSLGVLSVIAAGNSGPNSSTILTPGTSRTALTVGSVSKSKVISSFSSRGPVVNGDEVIVKPDVVAPGELICSAELFNSWMPEKRCLNTEDKTHIELSGTSMATPHVAGLAALIMQLHSDWTPVEIKTAIKDNAENLNLDPNAQGSGLINAFNIFGVTPTPIPPLKTAKVIASEDAHVAKTYPNKNFGKSSVLVLDQTPRRITYLKFDLSRFVDKQIQSIKLSLTVSKTSESYKNGGAAIYLTEPNWTEDKITFNNKPKFEILLQKSIRLPKSNTNYIVNLTNDLKSLYLGKPIYLALDSFGNFTPGLYLNSREAISGKPALIIEYR